MAWATMYLHLPPGKPVDEQFVVRLSLKEWQWKLSGIDLPEPMRMQLAQEIIKQQKKKRGMTLAGIS